MPLCSSGASAGCSVARYHWYPWASHWSFQAWCHSPKSVTNKSITRTQLNKDMQFKATVSARSSRRSSGPPGEAKVLQLNPQRREIILNHTGWSHLVEGTLNLEVEQSVVEILGHITPAIREPGQTVQYPSRYKHIPVQRVAYLYFDAILLHKGKEEPVLIRRAENPLKERIEAFAPVMLRETLDLSDGDEITCSIKNQ